MSIDQTEICLLSILRQKEEVKKRLCQLKSRIELEIFAYRVDYECDALPLGHLSRVITKDELATII